MEPKQPGKLRIRVVSLGALCLFFLGILVFFGAISSAQASSIISVTTTADETDPADGACSLREAIAAIATGATSGGTTGECPAGNPGDAILVPSGTYTLSQGELIITTSLTISGSGQIDTLLDGNSQHRVIEIASPAAAVAIDGLTISDGYTASAPLVGGILNSGTLTLTHSAVVSNTGDGVYSLGSLLVLNSVVSGNTGSGIYNEAGVAAISGTTAWHNLDGGLYNWYGVLTVTNSLILSNTTNNGGSGAGGIGSIGYNVDIISTTISDNSNTGTNGAGGLFIAYASGTITNSTISHNSGSGIQMYSPGVVNIDHSVITGNEASGSGGGIWTDGGTVNLTDTTVSNNISHGGNFGGGGISTSFTQLTVVSSTLSGNSADYAGGALSSTGIQSITLMDSTVTGNHAGLDGGALETGGNPLTVISSTLSTNSAGGCGGAAWIGAYGSNLSIVGSTIVSDTASNGGGVCARGPLTLTNTSLVSNTANNGGGIYVYSGTQALIQDSDLTGNQSAIGAAIYNLGSLILSNTNIISNTSSDSGVIQNGWYGAPQTPTVATATVQNSLFAGNSAAFSGGAIENFVSSMLTVTQTSFQHNLTAGQGIIINEGQAWVSGSSFDGNQARAGGAIYNDVTLNVIDSTFSHNAATDSGGAIASLNGTAVISDSTFDGNSAGFEGGAVYGGALTLTNTSLVNNTAVQHGGAIASVTGDPVSASAITVTNNTAQFGGGLFTLGTLRLSNSLIFSNSVATDGGGVYSYGSGVAGRTPPPSVISQTQIVSNTANHGGGVFANYVLELTGSTLMSNTAALSGGGIYGNGKNLSVDNSTIALNRTAGYGGGIYVGNEYSDTLPALTLLNNVTLSGNVADGDNNGNGTGGGVFVELTSTVRLSNTIIAGNQDLSGLAPDCAGALVTGGHNLIQSTLGCTLSSTATGDITGTAALLGPLQDNGGPTWTEALLPGSPAIDAGSPTTPGSGGGACEATDQRGVARPQGLACDIGAFEAVGLSATATVQLAGSAFTTIQSAGSVPITVTLSRAMPVTVTVQYSTTDSTAIAGHDYLAAAGTVTFTPGVTQATFAVSLLADEPGEPDESFGVALSAPANATQGTPSTATVTLVDDEPPPTVALSSSQYTVTESAGTAMITATLSAASGLTATVDYATSDGTALAGSDYTPVSGTLTFTPGVTQTIFTVPIAPVSLHDADKAFSVGLSSPTSATLGAPYTATVTILNDHPAPSVSFTTQAYTVTESAGSAAITVTLSSVSGLTATVDFATSDGSATAGSDYTPVSGTLTFTPGVTQTALTIPIMPDPLHGADKSLSVALSNPAGASLGLPYTATVTILNNHPMPDVSFTRQAYTVTESAGSAAITVTLSSASGLTATVHYATSNGTATAGSDYTPVSGTLTFAPGQVQRAFMVPITNDTQLEGPETVLLTLSSPVEATLISPSSATLTILDSTVEYRVYLPAILKP